MGVNVVGVSFDKGATQKKFVETHSLPFPLIADTDGAVVKAFGVKLLRPGLCSREAFLIKGGKIAWLDRKASTTKQAEDVIAAIKASK